MLALFAATLSGTIIAFLPGFSVVPIGMGDGLLLAFLSLHFVWAFQMGLQLLQNDLPDRRYTGNAAEGLFFFGVFLFLFDYIYASNAGMDYVQRFIAGGGTIQLAPDTTTERLLVAGHYLPLILVDALLWLDTGILRERRGKRAIAPALMVLSVLLSVLSYPSFAHKEGIAVLGWVGMVPLFVLIRREVSARRPGRAIWYGLLYGVLFTLIGNYWLGTFNLISLQAVGVIFLFFYLLYIPLVVLLLALMHRFRARAIFMVLILPLTWTTFELARSSGFLGYPWLLAAHSQYQAPWMIQTARYGGVWMVSFIVLTVNALIAEGVLRRKLLWVVAAAAVVVGNGLFGFGMLQNEVESNGTVRLALIQQNSDPRKHNYSRTFESLTALTDETLGENPDLVVWSETAFVPNIRRWSQEDPERFALARLVRRFTDYLEGVDTWLLTGNDDYRRILDEEGNEIDRDSYNASVLFSPEGERMETYHKVKLVPFTEYFPYRRQLPWVYDMLMNVDIHFWTPGTEYTVFHHPQFRFATPICFEDVFPGVVRRFALNGMEVIVNITNDYWSLREQAAQQHFAAALFRAVELEKPMVRSTASGRTGHIDARGRIIATAPQYAEEALVVDVAVPARGQRETPYQRWGDWFPVATGILAILILIAAVIQYVASGRKGGGLGVGG